MKAGVDTWIYRAEELQTLSERVGKSYARVARRWVIKQPGFYIIIFLSYGHELAMDQCVPFVFWTVGNNIGYLEIMTSY